MSWLSEPSKSFPDEELSGSGESAAVWGVGALLLALLTLSLRAR